MIVEKNEWMPASASESASTGLTQVVCDSSGIYWQKFQ